MPRWPGLAWIRLETDYRIKLDDCAYVDNVPSGLEVADVGVGEQRVLLVGVEEREVLHDDGHEQVQDDVSYDDVEAAIVGIVRLTD